MRTKESLATLIAELEGDFVELRRVFGHNSRAWERILGGAKDVLDYAALAFTLHNLYGILENYFLRTSKYFENNLPAEMWHKTLVDRMALDIPGIRPALLHNPEDRGLVMALLKFRHRFRNLYGEDLNPILTDQVQVQALELIEIRFPQIHKGFIEKLTQIAEVLE